MKYQKKDGSLYLIYLYSDYRKTWKIETLPFNGSCSEVSEKDKDKFIKQNKLKLVKEPLNS